MSVDTAKLFEEPLFAQVIVDVPAKQTDRPFDYRVPTLMRDWIDIGSRVGVPFGPRVLQGFVVGLSSHTATDMARIKPISELLDWIPPLNHELVALARWMSRTYLCPEIISLQAMIPGALKAKYERRIALSETGERLGQQQSDSWPKQMKELYDYLLSKDAVDVNALTVKFSECAPILKKWLSEGLLTETLKVRDRMSVKRVLTVFPPDDTDLLVQAWKDLPASASRQKDVLQYFIDQPKPIRLSDLLAELSLSSGTVKALAGKGFLDIREVEVQRDPYADRTFTPTMPLPLTPEQQQVFAPIRSAVVGKSHDVFLLHGVTGSGKTEVYLQSIQACLETGREAIVLVPEISLTPQMVERFKGRFGSRVAVLHSRLSQGERYDEWRKINKKQVQVVIGARSAIFAPFANIGLIIIDEEHESSYKQEESPKYHARDVAIERAKRYQASVVLGSATPSLESLEDTNRGFHLLRMLSRVEGRPLPKVHIIDLRQELKEGNRSMFSRALYKAIEERLHKKEQMVLLLNRRGHSTFVMCRSCGYVAQCPHCDISLTYHRHSNTVRCHYCGYSEHVPSTCPTCSSEHIRYFGTGTQRVEEELSKLFPGIRVIRMDVDTTSEKGSHEKWLTMFKNREADVLLGTQMVAKGLDFPFVTLVGVITADTMLNLPDFRSAERTFQMLTQVAGRAGRHHLPGEVYIQTYTPEHYSVAFAGNHDYEAFASAELKLRRTLGYPPYCQLILITISHEQLAIAIRAGELLAQEIRTLWKQSVRLGDPEQEAGESLEVHGPVASPIPRIKDRYRFQCMVKYRGDRDPSALVAQAAAKFDEWQRKDQLQISMDVNPQVMM
jgi:primosomal protein N' (replication factor Y) (superfamily II helicase)